MTRSVAVCLAALMPTLAMAVPSAVSFQGRLTDPLGVPLEDPTAIEVSLYSAPANGVLLWSGSATVDPEGGYFALTLGAPPMAPIDSSVLSSDQAWVEVVADDQTMPRLPLASVPFALVASEIDFDVVDNDDPRLVWSAAISPDGTPCVANTWCDAGPDWGVNRLSDTGRYTQSSDWDTSAYHVDLVLDDNAHRTVLMTHLDWTNSGAFDVLLSFDAGASWSFHKRVETYRSVAGTPYTSQLRTLATNLPLGEDVRVRIRGAYGRMHIEGFALSRSLHPEHADGDACPIGTVRVRGFCIQRQTTAPFGQAWTEANDHCTDAGLRLCGHHEILSGIRTGAVPLYDYSVRDAWFVTAQLSEDAPGSGGLNQTCDIQGNYNQPSHPVYSTQCSHPMQTDASWRTTVCCH